MEKYSLIDLIEDNDETEDDEDNDYETDNRKKRYHLALSILGFITNKKASVEDSQETEILASLFNKPTEEQAKEFEIKAKSFDAVVLANSIVENRIVELSQETTLDSSSENNSNKIEALEEIRDYLVSDIQDYVEPIIDPKLNNNLEPTDPTKPNTAQKFTKRIHEQSKPRISKETKLKKPKSGIKLNDRLVNLKPSYENRMEIPNEYRTENKPIDKFKYSPEKLVHTTIVSESLDKTRELIKSLYSPQSEVPIKKPETIKIENTEPISQYKYLDISKKIIIDNVSLNQFFNNNHFNQKTRIRIVSEILKGEKPAKVLEKEMRKRGKFKNLIKSYSPINSTTLDSMKVNNLTSIQTQEQLVKKNNTRQNFLKPKTWSIIIILLIILIILFIIL
ncbi:MAG TPA: hypothetical protein VII94_05195 [Candidatus Saccharimonadales bacterium]